MTALYSGFVVVAIAGLERPSLKVTSVNVGLVLAAFGLAMALVGKAVIPVELLVFAAVLLALSYRLTPTGLPCPSYMTGLVVVVALALGFKAVPGLAPLTLAGVTLNTGKIVVVLTLSLFLWHQPRQLPLPGSRAMTVTAWICTLIVIAGGLVYLVPALAWSAQSPVRWLGNVLVTVTAEEFFFRGVCLTVMLRYCQPFAALLIISVIFGVVHVPMGAMFAVCASAAGFLYGYVYVRTGRLSAAIALHALLNVPLVLAIE